MKIIFSPSKTQKIRKLFPVTKPIFLSKSESLLSKLIGMSVSDTMKSFKVSEKIASGLNTKYHESSVMGNALVSYTGTAFNQIDLGQWSKESWDFAQKHLYILSGLYGALRPKDAIQSHRLDVADKVLGKNLFEFWAGDIEKLLVKEEQILNLASKEYSSMLTKETEQKVLTVDFVVSKNGEDKKVAIFAKQQRGKMLNYIVLNKLTNFEELKKYSSDGFVFSKERSTVNRYIFVLKK